MAELTLPLQHAVHMIPQDDPDYAKRSGHLALLFEDQFHESAINTMKKALHATREDDLYRAKRLSIPGHFLKDKFIEREETTDIEEAISYAQQAFDITMKQ